MTSVAEPGTFARGELSDKVLEFCQVLQRMVAEAKHHETLPADFWEPLKVFVDVPNYRRCSQDYSAIVDAEKAERESGYDARPYATSMLTWDEWTAVAGEWALSPSHWEYTVMRIAEFTIPGLPGVVYLELEERGGFTGQPDQINWANTILLFEFNPEGKLGVLRLGVADYALRTWPACHASTGVTAQAGQGRLQTSGARAAGTAGAGGAGGANAAQAERTRRRRSERGAGGANAAQAERTRRRRQQRGIQGRGDCRRRPGFLARWG
jgi:hypothetical protein